MTQTRQHNAHWNNIHKYISELKRKIVPNNPLRSKHQQNSFGTKHWMGKRETRSTITHIVNKEQKKDKLRISYWNIPIKNWKLEFWNRPATQVIRHIMTNRLTISISSILGITQGGKILASIEIKPWENYSKRHTLKSVLFLGARLRHFM